MLYSYSHAASHPAWQDSINLGIRRVVATYPTADPYSTLPSSSNHKVTLCIGVTVVSPGLVRAHPGPWQSREPARAMNITLQDEGFLHLLTVFYNKHNA